ncbi:MAG: threonine--tRNA ligase [Gammaproteobacteria bacterium]|nr:threonine--tRNA ligase [Gammaproteobacteria bacterium]
MIKIQLPGGESLLYKKPMRVLQIAEDISPALTKAAIAAEVDGRLVDLDYMIEKDAHLRIITDKDPEGLDVIRHSTAHLLAHAVKTLFPQAQVTIGPVIQDGFYYDFSFERPFTPEDLEKIEAKMHEIANQNLPLKRKVLSRREAIERFKNMGERYKVEIISDLPEGEEISLYEQGDFVDLCRGPHVPRTDLLKVFKLIKIAGAYWRGDSKNEMLQRIYGTAWLKRKDLDQYLEHIAEAEKRDHRKIGKQLDLFHFQEEAPGNVFWHDKGWTVYRIIQQYVREILQDHGYQEVNTPIIMDRSIWERSGHWEKFHENMFITYSENKDYAIKPMNCPGHIQIFNQGLKSYRDLPMRTAEFGFCHRNEPSGSLHGMMRVRAFTQDDAHIFCTEAQLLQEVNTLIDLTYKVYKDFGFHEVLVKLATRPEKRIGSDESWDRAEKALEDALNGKGLAFQLSPGDGAFYGPKIEFSLKDCLDRVWQCGTVQIDFSMPDRLGARYIEEDGSRQIPVMVHRVLLGSLERFIGILTEHYAGLFPLWLAPVQVAVFNITDRQADYAQKIVETLRKQGFRAISDLRNEKIGLKIREHTLQKIPYMIVIGDREVENNLISVRTQEGKDLGSMSVNDLISKLKEIVSNRD